MTTLPVITDTDYAIHKQVQDCYFQAAQSYKDSLVKECLNNCQENSHIQQCVQDCQQKNIHNQDCEEGCQTANNYFRLKPCGIACSYACK